MSDMFGQISCVEEGFQLHPDASLEEYSEFTVNIYRILPWQMLCRNSSVPGNVYSALSRYGMDDSFNTIDGAI